MLQRRPTAQDVEQSKPTGIIDSLGLGFALLARRPYLVWLPVLVDVAIWLSAGLSVQPFTAQLLDWMRQAQQADQQTIRALETMGNHYDLLALLGWILPSLMAELGRDAVASVGGTTWLTGFDWWVVPLAAVGLAVGGLILGMIYLTAVARLVREEPIRLGAFARSSLRNSASMLAFILIVGAGATLVLLPALVAVALLAVLGLNLIGLFEFVLSVVLIWLACVVYFAKFSIALSDAGPLRALYLSYNVVRRNVWASLGFVGTSLLIRVGVPLALQVFAATPWGVPFAIVGNAFIVTGVFAAAMLFFRDRAERLPAPGTSSSSPPTRSA